MTTPRELITGALRLINVVQANEVPTAADIDIGFDALNNMLDSWSTEKLSIFSMNPYEFNFIAGQKEYTLGPGGDWDIERPMDLLKMYVMYLEGGGECPIIPPAPPTIQYLFNATLESAIPPYGINYDLEGNWIYELGSNYPGLAVDTAQGSPPSPLASLLNTGNRRFYIQAADNAPPINGTSALTTSAHLDETNWTYSIWFYPVSPGTTNINLGGFNPGGGGGQAVFSLNFYYNTPYLETRINDNAGSFYIGNDVSAITYNAWHHAEIRKTGLLLELYLDDVLLGSQSYSGTFLPANLISFGVDRSENGSRNGYVDQVQLFYRD